MGIIRKLVRFLTAASLAAATVLAGLWAIADFDLEPWVTLLALVAAAGGLWIDPWLRTRERRHGILRDLAHELLRSRRALESSQIATVDGSMVMYPRVTTSVTEVAISNGLFSSGRDGRLYKLMHDWHKVGSDFNRILEVNENAGLHMNVERRIELQRSLADGAAHRSTKAHLMELAACVFDRYAEESGIDRDTTLFPDGGPQVTIAPAAEEQSNTLQPERSTV